MADYCTIYSTDLDNGRIQADLKALGAEIEVQGEPSCWSRIIIRREATSIILTKLTKGVPQDKFARTVLGTFAAAKGVQFRDDETKRTFLDRVSRTRLIIGVVAEPILNGFAADVIMAVTLAVNGFVFNGDEFMDADGYPLA